MAKPSKLPSWDTTEVNSTEPDSTHQDEGWLAPGGIPEKPPFQTFNHWMNATWKWLKEFNKQGIVEWDGTTEYDINDFTKGSNGLRYQSLTTNSNKNPLTNPVDWIEVDWRGETVTHDMASDADYTLTVLQNRYSKIIITDSGVLLTVARNIIVDNIQKSFTVQNDTAQDLTFKTIAGTGIIVLAGKQAILTNDAVNVIDNFSDVLEDLVSELPSFANSLSISGYQKLPNGLIIQWGEGLANVNGGSGVQITLPITFPTAGAVAAASFRGGAAAINVIINNLATTFLEAETNDTSSLNINWIAIGY